MAGGSTGLYENIGPFYVLWALELSILFMPGAPGSCDLGTKGGR